MRFVKLVAKVLSDQERVKEISKDLPKDRAKKAYEGNPDAVPGIRHSGGYFNSPEFIKRIQDSVDQERKKNPGKTHNEKMREAAKELGIREEKSVFKIWDTIEAMMASSAKDAPRLSKILFEIRKNRAEVNRTYSEEASREIERLREEGVEILRQLRSKK